MAKREPTPLPPITLTAAPWRVTHQKMGVNAISYTYVEAEKNGVFKRYICRVQSLDEHGRDNSEVMAQAIALLPTIIQTLQRIAGDYQAMRVAHLSHPGHENDGMCPTIAEAYSLINKARGQQ